MRLARPSNEANDLKISIRPNRAVINPPQLMTSFPDMRPRRRTKKAMTLASLPGGMKEHRAYYAQGKISIQTMRHWLDMRPIEGEKAANGGGHRKEWFSLVAYRCVSRPERRSGQPQRYLPI